MSDVKIEQKAAMTRAEAAQWLADLSKQLSGGGSVSLRLAGTTVEMKVPDDVRFEAEVEVDGDEVELELELTWSTAQKPPPTAAKKAAAGS